MGGKLTAVALVVSVALLTGCGDDNRSKQYDRTRQDTRRERPKTTPGIRYEYPPQTEPERERSKPRENDAPREQPRDTDAPRPSEAQP